MADDDQLQLSRDVFIREVAIEADCTIADAKKFVAAFQTVLEKAVLARATLKIRGIGNLEFKEIKARRGYNAKKYRDAMRENPDVDRTDERFYSNLPPVIKVKFSLAKNLKDLLKRGVG